MKQLVLIIIFLFSFSKTKVGKPIISSSKIAVSPSLNINCTMGTIRVCHDSKNRHCHCKIDFDSSPLKTAKKCTNGTNLLWLENNKKFTPTCMKIYDPKKPLNCPFGYRLTNYTTNSSILVPYCSKNNKSIFKSIHFGTSPIKYLVKPDRSRNNYLLSLEYKKRMGLIPNKNN